MGWLETYDYYWNQNADPRTNDLPLIGSIFTIPTILFCYMYFIFKCGPRYMKDRKPYDLKTYNQFYNVFQIISNAYIVYRYIDAGWFTEISVFCEIPDFSFNRGPFKIAVTIWLTTILKVIDLSETMVFVLRKKNNQISFLHVYHHVSTVIVAWIHTKYGPVAMVSFSGLINSMVHVLMYTYYLLSTFGPEVRAKLNKFKPTLTIIQMVQLVCIILHLSQVFFTDCNVTKIPSIVMGTNITINLVLFYNFYQKTYVKKPKKKTPTTETTKNR